MPVRVKLFFVTQFGADQFIDGEKIPGGIEEAMNKFLEGLQSTQVKKIYVALGPDGQKMGLIEYDSDDTV